MYNYAEIIYGIPLSEKIRSLPLTENLLSLMKEDYADLQVEVGQTIDEVDGLDFLSEKYGLTTRYSGSGDGIPGFFGISLETLEPFNSKGENFNVFPTQPTVTNQEKTQVTELISKLPQEIKDIAEPIGFYLVWCTS